MNIPDEAVEAAVKVIRADTDKALTSPLTELIRTILEAAAPYMLAPVLALADQWQEDFPYKANQLREAVGANRIGAKHERSYEVR